MDAMFDRIDLCHTFQGAGEGDAGGGAPEPARCATGEHGGAKPLAGLAVNFHINHMCDARCTFCFSKFNGNPDDLPVADAMRVIDELRTAGAEKLTFAGGEPTLHPHLGALVDHAKSVGLVTSIVSNGARLEEIIGAHGHNVDWVCVSVDSADEFTQQALGRGRGGHVVRAIRLSDLCRARGIRFKLNTVVTALTWQEDMSALVSRMAPERWKVFQVMRVAGQNDGRVEPLLISKDQFESFQQRHACLAAGGFPAVAEADDSMIDSYVMVDPMGRFFGNSGHVHSTSSPILAVGVRAALAEVGFDPSKFDARGGKYAWGASSSKAAA
jgi:radical S-adenosyl methionine domain-containing protein 2